ncbi:MAG: glycosyltransferase family 1 protein [Armatimonadota bacterium]|nr:glycosyltransferase family 4 protein [Armatimonadota bacterium]MCX7778123.1 glycosyltransferase family 4 protein [Armatimonadota bacterium]MDW8024835.1 glycosyltransferase family 1 protein [Armatimonadota bacterium]
MRILFYAPIEVFRRPAGSGIYVRELLHTLLNVDTHNCYIIWHGCMMKRPLDTQDVLIPDLARGRVKVSITPFPTRLFHDRKLRLLLLRLNRLPIGDVLFGSPDIYFSPFYPLLPHLRGSLVLTIFDLTPLTHPHCHIPSTIDVTRMTMLWAKRATRLLTFSNTVKEQLASWFGFPREKVVVTPLAPAKHFKPQPKERVERILRKYGLPEQFIIYVGVIEPRKNLTTLLRAFAALKGSLPHKLVFAGDVGWYGESVLNEIISLGLQEHVIRVGYVPDEDLPALICGAEALVYPSLAEGYGLPVIEAMACGTPVICSSAPALPEIAEGAALMVSPHDVYGWAKAIMQLLTDSDLRHELSQKGLERASQFSWEQTAKLTLSAFEEAAMEANS